MPQKIVKHGWSTYRPSKKRDASIVKTLQYKKSMVRAYNKKVRARSFQMGDLVLNKVEVSHHVGKLDPN